MLILEIERREIRMFRYIVFPALLMIIIASCGSCWAEPTMPDAPAALSWLPHGYGATMQLNNPIDLGIKRLHGFRLSPAYLGSWSEPVWGWDVNSTYYAPNAPSVDPGLYQLPLGLIYPDNVR